MTRDLKGYLKPAEVKTDFLKIVPEINLLADIDIKDISNIDSSNMTIDIWKKLIRAIERNYNLYDGFVIIHGTDTMVYTASALSFAIHNLHKPVILTGAQKPLSDIPTDARNNLLNSIIVAGYSLPEVLIVFGSKILRGNRTTKISESAFEAFDSPMFPPIGLIQLKPVISSNYRVRKNNKKTEFYADFNKNVFVFKIHPGINPQYVRKFLLDSWEGIVLEAFGAGNVSESLMPILKDANKKEIPVIVTSQCHKGITKTQLYYAGYKTLENGAIPAGDMIPEAAVIKLMWILSRTKNINKIKKLFLEDIAGEITINKNYLN